MYWLTRYFYPSIGQIETVVDNINKSWEITNDTTPYALERARQGLEIFVDFHQSAGNDSTTVNKKLMQCISLVRDSPRHQAFARQAIFQPVRGRLATSEDVLTTKVTRLKAAGESIVVYQQELKTKFSTWSSMEREKRNELLQNLKIWFGSTSSEFLTAQKSHISDLIKEEDWLAAFEETIFYIQKGGVLNINDDSVTQIENIINKIGVFSGTASAERLSSASHLVSVIKSLLIDTIPSNIELLSKVRTLHQQLTDLLNKRNPSGHIRENTASPSDRQLIVLETYVEELKSKLPDIHHIAQEKLNQVKSEHPSIAVIARSYLTNLKSLTERTINTTGTTIMDDKQRKEHLNQAEQILEEVVHGHLQAKRMLLAMVDERLRNPSNSGGLLALCGTHGNGKTTLVTNGLVKILGLGSVVIDMAGMKNTCQLLGNLPVYIGAEPGKLFQALVKLNKTSGILVFDEIEKASLEVQDAIANLIDSTRNSACEITYFTGIPIDLSHMFFAFTLNDETRLSPTLKARLSESLIMTNDLTENEKIKIARSFFIPKAMANVQRNDIVLEDEAIRYIIRNHTDNEGGARRLKGHIFSLIRDFSLRMTQGCLDRVITKEMVHQSNIAT